MITTVQIKAFHQNEAKILEDIGRDFPGLKPSCLWILTVPRLMESEIMDILHEFEIYHCTALHEREENMNRLKQSFYGFAVSVAYNQYNSFTEYKKKNTSFDDMFQNAIMSIDLAFADFLDAYYNSTWKYSFNIIQQKMYSFVMVTVKECCEDIDFFITSGKGGTEPKSILGEFIDEIFGSIENIHTTNDSKLLQLYLADVDHCDFEAIGRLVNASPEEAQRYISEILSRIRNKFGSKYLDLTNRS